MNVVSMLRDLEPGDHYSEHEVDEQHIATSVQTHLRFQVSLMERVAPWGAAATFSLLLALVIARSMHLVPATGTGMPPTAWIALPGFALCVAFLVAYAVAVEFEDQFAAK